MKTRVVAVAFLLALTALTGCGGSSGGGGVVVPPTYSGTSLGNSYEGACTAGCDGQMSRGQIYEVSVDAAVDTTDYTVTIGATDYIITSDADATIAEIEAALVACINNGGADCKGGAPATGSAIFTAVAGSVILRNDDPDDDTTVTVGANLSIQEIQAAGEDEDAGAVLGLLQFALGGLAVEDVLDRLNQDFGQSRLLRGRMSVNCNSTGTDPEDRGDATGGTIAHDLAVVIALPTVASPTTFSITWTLTVTFNDCELDGTTIDGTITQELELASAAGAVTLSVSQEGFWTFSGDVEGILDVAILVEIDASNVTTSSGGICVGDDLNVGQTACAAAAATFIDTSTAEGDAALLILEILGGFAGI